MMAIPILPKPAYGSPCNGCGRCCHDEICPLGAIVLRRSAGPCPALQPGEGGALVCGLIATPIRYAPAETLRAGPAAMSEAAALLVGAGHGCDAQLEGEPGNLPFRAKMRAVLAQTRPQAGAAAARWGIRS